MRGESFFDPDGSAGVAFAGGEGPEHLVVGEELVEFEGGELGFLEFSFLEGEDVGRKLGDEFLEGAAVDDGAEAVDVPAKHPGVHLAPLMRRSASRALSRRLRVSRLSYNFLPRPRAISSLMKRLPVMILVGMML